MKNNQPFKTKTHALGGKAAMDFFKKEDLNTLATKLIFRYSPDRFDATVLRFYMEHGKITATFYAVDKMKQEDKNYPKDKLPVKKFKIKITFEDRMAHIKRYNCTLSNDAYDIKDMLVMNK